METADLKEIVFFITEENNKKRKKAFIFYKDGISIASYEKALDELAMYAKLTKQTTSEIKEKKIIKVMSKNELFEYYQTYYKKPDNDIEQRQPMNEVNIENESIQTEQIKKKTSLVDDYEEIVKVIKTKTPPKVEPPRKENIFVKVLAKIKGGRR